jgi:hypothetical protein
LFIPHKDRSQRHTSINRPSIVLLSELSTPKVSQTTVLGLLPSYIKSGASPILCHVLRVCVSLSLILCQLGCKLFQFEHVSMLSHTPRTLHSRSFCSGRRFLMVLPLVANKELVFVETQRSCRCLNLRNYWELRESRLNFSLFSSEYLLILSIVRGDICILRYGFDHLLIWNWCLRHIDSWVLQVSTRELGQWIMLCLGSCSLFFRLLVHLTIRNITIW